MEREEEGGEFKPPKYVMIPLDVLVRLIVCVIFDVAEFLFPIFLIPLVGDMLDVVGLGVGLLMFGWVGGLAALEFLPMADYFPIFISTWALWYYLQRERARREREKLEKKWR